MLTEIMYILVSFRTPETEKTTPTKETTKKVHIDQTTPISVTKVKRPMPLSSESGPQMKKPRTEEMRDFESFDYNKTTFTNSVTGISPLYQVYINFNYYRII